MTLIEGLIRIVLGAMGIGFLCMVVFLVGDSEKKAEGVIEGWWILFDDIKNRMIPWQRALTTVCATKTREWLDCCFPPPVFSKRTFSAASMFTLGFFMLIIGAAYSGNLIQRYFYTSLGITELFLAFVPSRYPKFNPILYGAALINLVFWGFFAILFLIEMSLKLPTDGSIIETEKSFELCTVLFTASLIGPLVVLLLLRFVRSTLTRAEQTQSDWRAFIGLFLPSVLPWVTFLFAYPFRDTVSGSLFFDVATVCIPGIALVTLICIICTAVAVLMITHRLFYPVVNKAIWLIDAHKIVKNKRLLLALAGACMLGAWKGHGFGDSILKILGLT